MAGLGQCTWPAERLLMADSASSKSVGRQIGLIDGSHMSQSSTAASGLHVSDPPTDLGDERGRRPAVRLLDGYQLGGYISANATICRRAGITSNRPTPGSAMWKK